MKKIFIAVLAVAAMASCATDEVVNAPKGAAIGFDETFVDNAVRANDINASNLENHNFRVYGSVVKDSQTGIIFNGTLVSKGITNGELDSAWKYEGTHYWIPSASYYFVGLAPATNAHWSYNYGTDDDAYSGTITFDNAAASANQDLIFDNDSRVTGATIQENPAKVGFSFSHILSRVKFTFTNAFDASNNITLKVTDVVLEGLYPTGTVAVENGTVGTWSAAGTTFNKTFGAALTADAADNDVMTANLSATTEHFYVIPTNVTYTVKFKVTLYQAGVEIDTYDRQAPVTINAVKGYSYEVKADLTAANVSDDDAVLEPIEFNVDAVADWATFTDVDIPDEDIEKLPAQGN